MNGVDLAQWLTAQLAEDERTARAACWDDQSDVWTARPPQASYERYTVVDYCDDGVVAVTPENADADGVGQHIAEHDPARVLREIDAKRKLVRLLTEALEAGEDYKGPDLYDGIETCRAALRLLALPYAGRDGYLAEWAPSE